jgi:uncharacterized protein YciI
MTEVNPIADYAEGKSMLGLELYLLNMTAIEPFDDPMKAYFGEHRAAFDEYLEWLRQIEADGAIFASVVLKDETSRDGSDMVIIRAASYADALEVAEAEPFHRAGLRKNTIQGWVMNEANFQFTLKLMSQEIVVT